MEKLLLVQGVYSWPPLPVMPDGAALDHAFHGLLWGPLDGTYSQDGGTNRLPDRVKVNVLEDRFGPADVLETTLDEAAGTLRFTKSCRGDSRVGFEYSLRRDGGGLWLGTYTRSNDGGNGIVRCSVTVTDESFFFGVRPIGDAPA